MTIRQEIHYQEYLIKSQQVFGEYRQKYSLSPIFVIIACFIIC